MSRDGRKFIEISAKLLSHENHSFLTLQYQFVLHNC